MVHGQSYVSAGGLRLGTEWGLSYKHRILERTTLEGILQSSFQDQTNKFSLLYSKHFPIITRGFNIYAGGGAHLGWREEMNDFEYTLHGGLSLIGGAEITIGRINVSWDIKPAFNLIGSGKYRFLDMNTAVSLRYVFIKKSSGSNKKSKSSNSNQSSGTKRKSKKL
jgi:hypothetical protein